VLNIDSAQLSLVHCLYAVRSVAAKAERGGESGARRRKRSAQRLMVRTAHAHGAIFTFSFFGEGLFLAPSLMVALGQGSIRTGREQWSFQASKADRDPLGAVRELLHPCVDHVRTITITHAT
jgi:hypothetical protein